jgi:hypothetical protein
MSSRRATIASGIASGLRATLLLLLMIGIFFGARSMIAGASPINQILVAVQRLFAIAVNDTSEMRWLVLLCLAAGLFVLSDRRRRGKVRQASA